MCVCMAKNFGDFCTAKTNKLIYPPANYHKSIGLIESLIQTIKRQLSCMKARLNKVFMLPYATNAIA